METYLGNNVKNVFLLYKNSFSLIFKKKNNLVGISTPTLIDSPDLKVYV